MPDLRFEGKIHSSILNHNVLKKKLYFYINNVRVR